MPPRIGGATHQKHAITRRHQKVRSHAHHHHKRSTHRLLHHNFSTTSFTPTETANTVTTTTSALKLPSTRTYTRLLVVDAFSILFRSHFALQRSHVRRGNDGRAISGLSGFLNTLLKITKEVKPTHLAVCMDTPATIGFRRKLFDQYKKDRGGRDDDLVWQIQQLPYIVQSLGIPTLIVPGFEADDVVASVCHKVKDEKRVMKRMFYEQQENDDDYTDKFKKKSQKYTQNKFFDDGYGVFGDNEYNKYKYIKRARPMSDQFPINTGQFPSDINHDGINEDDILSYNVLDPDYEEITVKKTLSERMLEKDFYLIKISSVINDLKKLEQQQSDLVDFNEIKQLIMQLQGENIHTPNSSCLEYGDTDSNTFGTSHPILNKKSFASKHTEYAHNSSATSTNQLVDIYSALPHHFRHQIRIHNPCTHKSIDEYNLNYEPQEYNINLVQYPSELSPVANHSIEHSQMLLKSIRALTENAPVQYDIHLLEKYAQLHDIKQSLEFENELHNQENQLFNMLNITHFTCYNNIHDLIEQSNVLLLFQKGYVSPHLLKEFFAYRESKVANFIESNSIEKQYTIGNTIDDEFSNIEKSLQLTILLQILSMLPHSNYPGLKYDKKTANISKDYDKLVKASLKALKPSQSIKKSSKSSTILKTTKGLKNPHEVDYHLLPDFNDSFSTVDSQSAHHTIKKPRLSRKPKSANSNTLRERDLVSENIDNDDTIILKITNDTLNDFRTFASLREEMDKTLKGTDKNGVSRADNDNTTSNDNNVSTTDTSSPILAKHVPFYLRMTQQPPQATLLVSTNTIDPFTIKQRAMEQSKENQRKLEQELRLQQSQGQVQEQNALNDSLAMFDALRYDQTPDQSLFGNTKVNEEPTLFSPEHESLAPPKRKRGRKSQHQKDLESAHISQTTPNPHLKLIEMFDNEQSTLLPNLADDDEHSEILTNHLAYTQHEQTRDEKKKKRKKQLFSQQDTYASLNANSDTYDDDMARFDASDSENSGFWSSTEEYSDVDLSSNDDVDITPWATSPDYSNIDLSNSKLSSQAKVQLAQQQVTQHQDRMREELLRLAEESKQLQDIMTKQQKDVGLAGVSLHSLLGDNTSLYGSKKIDSDEIKLKYLMSSITTIDDDNIFYGSTHWSAIRSLLFRKIDHKWKEKQMNKKNGTDMNSDHSTGTVGAALLSQFDEHKYDTPKRTDNPHHETKSDQIANDIIDFDIDFDRISKQFDEFSPKSVVNGQNTSFGDEFDQYKHLVDPIRPKDPAATSIEDIKHSDITNNMEYTPDATSALHECDTFDPQSYGIYTSELYRAHLQSVAPSSSQICPDSEYITDLSNHKLPHVTTDLSTQYNQFPPQPQPSQLIHPIQAFTSYYIPFPTDNNGIYTPYYNSIQTPTFYDNLYYLTGEYQHDITAHHTKPSDVTVINNTTYKTVQLHHVLNNNSPTTESIANADDHQTLVNVTNKPASAVPTPLPVTMHNYSHIVSPRLPLSYPITREDERGTVFDLNSNKAQYDAWGTIYSKPQRFELPIPQYNDSGELKNEFSLFKNYLSSTVNSSPLPLYRTQCWSKIYPSIALPPQLLPIKLNNNLILTTQYKRKVVENISQRDIVRYGLYSMSPYSNNDEKSIYYNDFIPQIATHIRRGDVNWDAHTHTIKNTLIRHESHPHSSDNLQTVQMIDKWYATTPQPVGTVSVDANKLPLLPSPWYSNSQYHTASDHYVGPNRGWWSTYATVDTSQGGLNYLSNSSYSFYKLKHEHKSNGTSEEYTEGLFDEDVSSNKKDKSKPQPKSLDKAMFPENYVTSSNTTHSTTEGSSKSHNGPTDSFAFAELLSAKIERSSGDNDPETLKFIEKLLRGDDDVTAKSDGNDNDVNNLFVEGLKQTYTPGYGVHIKNNQDPLYNSHPFTYNSALQKKSDMLSSALPSELTKWLPYVDQIFVVSGDKDIEQVVSPHVTLIKHNGSPGIKKKMTKFPKYKTQKENRKLLSLAKPGERLDEYPFAAISVNAHTPYNTFNQLHNQHENNDEHGEDGDNDKFNFMLKQTGWLARNVKPIFQSSIPINELYDLSTKLNSFQSKQMHTTSISTTPHPATNPNNSSIEDFLPNTSTNNIFNRGNNIFDEELSKKDESRDLLGQPLYTTTVSNTMSSLFKKDPPADSDSYSGAEDVSCKKRKKSKTSDNFDSNDIFESYHAKRFINPTSLHSHHNTVTRTDNNDTTANNNKSDEDVGTSYSVHNYESLVRKYNMCTTQLPHLQSFSGDTSDNVPGIRGIGPGIAQKLISQFGDINNVIQAAALYLGYDSIQTQLLLDRTFARRQYQQETGIEATMGNNDMNILFDPLEMFMNAATPINSGQAQLPMNDDEKRSIGYNLIQQRKQMATAMKWPLSEKLTKQILNNLDSLIISLSLVSMREDLDIPSPKHFLYTGTDKKAMTKVFRHYNMFAMLNEMQLLGDENEENILKGAYNGEYGELLLDAGLYLHQVRQKLGVKQSDLMAIQDSHAKSNALFKEPLVNSVVQGKDGFLSYTRNIPNIPKKFIQKKLQFSSLSQLQYFSKVDDPLLERNTASNDNDLDEDLYYQLSHLRSKKQITTPEKDVIFTDYNLPKYACDHNLIKIAQHSFFRPSYATYGMGQVDGSYFTHHNPYSGTLNIKNELLYNLQKDLNKKKQEQITTKRDKKDNNSSTATNDIDSSSLPPTMNLIDLLKEHHYKTENAVTTKYVKDRSGNILLYLPRDVHKQFVFNLDDNFKQSDQDESGDTTATISSAFHPTKRTHFFSHKYLPTTTASPSSSISKVRRDITAIFNHVHSQNNFSTKSRNAPNSNDDSDLDMQLFSSNSSMATKHYNSDFKSQSYTQSSSQAVIKPPSPDLLTETSFDFDFIDLDLDYSKPSLTADKKTIPTPASTSTIETANASITIKNLDIIERLPVTPEVYKPIYNDSVFSPSVAAAILGSSPSSSSKKSASTSKPKKSLDTLPLQQHFTIYKSLEQNAPSVIHNDIDTENTSSTTTAKKSRSSKKFQTPVLPPTGIILSSVCPSNLQELPISVVLHGIVSSLDANVDIQQRIQNEKQQLNDHNTKVQHKPGLTVVRGLFSTVTIGQDNAHR